MVPASHTGVSNSGPGFPLPISFLLRHLWVAEDGSGAWVLDTHTGDHMVFSILFFFLFFPFLSSSFCFLFFFKK